MNRKVSIIGSGHVGASVARSISEKELADVVILDILEGVPQGKGLDMLEACPVEGSDAQVLGTNNYADTADSEIVIITAGLARRPGMSRDDLLAKNFAIVKAVTEAVIQQSPNCILLPVTNPLDAMCQAVYRVSGFPRQRVVGMAGVLDSARMRAFIAQELRVSVENTHAFVLGGHGDTMLPLPRYSTVAGIPITELMEASTIERIVKRTAQGGAEIVKLLGTGSAYYAPASAVVEMVEAILQDKRKILPCSTFLQGEYGIRDLFMGVPVKLGARGVEEIIQITLTPDEQAALERSADAVRELITVIKV